MEMCIHLGSALTCIAINLSSDLGVLASHQQRINCFFFLSFFLCKAFRACSRSLLPEVEPATFGFDLVSVIDPFLKVELRRNSKLTHLPPSKGEKMLWSVLQPTAHHLCQNTGRVQTWLIFPKSEMFWHVYLFNLFILTSSDYNWQQCVELTLDSVLDLSVTIMQKECEIYPLHNNSEQAGEVQEVAFTKRNAALALCFI